MRRSRRDKKQKLFIFIALTLVIAFITLLKLKFSELKFLHDIFSPIGELTRSIDQQRADFFRYFVSRKQLKKDNKYLKEKNDFYQVLLQDYEELEAENKRLKNLLNIKAPVNYKKKAAYVIGRSPDFWHKELVINLGNQDGIKLNDPVISNWGLVGRVKTVSYSTSIVQLIADNANWVSCVNNRSRFVGVLKGEDGKTGKLSYLLNNSDFKENDLIVTSGLGGLFPKGLPVGIVTRVKAKNKNEVPDVQVSFLTDFDHLEEVVVLIQ